MVYIYDGEDFKNFNTSNSAIPFNGIWQIAFDSKYNVWAASANGLIKFDGTNWTVWDTGNSAIPTNVVNKLTIDSEDNIWFACMDEDRIVGGEYGGGLTKFDGQTMTTYNMTNSGLLANTIFGILNDGDKLWLATYGAGLMCFDKKDKLEVYDVTNSGIANNLVQGVIKDKNGNIWMGHNDAGISVFNPDLAIQTTGIVNEVINDDKNYELIIYPNPVNSQATLVIDLDAKAEVSAVVYDLGGRKVFDVLSGDELSAGENRVTFSTNNLSTGVYFFKVYWGNNEGIGKFIVKK